MIRIKDTSFITKILLRKEGEDIKIKRATVVRDKDRGTEYVTYNTISTRALITNVSGFVEIVYPFGKAYEGDYLMILDPKEEIDTRDRIIYNDHEYKIKELHDRKDFKEVVVEEI